MTSTWSKLKNHFGSGLLVLAPLFITIRIILYLVRLMDRLVVDPIFTILPVSTVEASFKEFLMKSALALLVTLFICLIGLLAERFFFKRFLQSMEVFFSNVPLFNKLYLSVREIAQAFFGDKSGIFKKAVYVEYPRKGLWTLGLMTQDRAWDVHEKTGISMVSVFIPHPPNPAAGFLVFVPKEELLDAGITVEEAIKMVISGGAAVPLLKKANGGD